MMNKLVVSLKNVNSNSIRRYSSSTMSMSNNNDNLKVLDIKQHKFSVAPMMEYTDRHMRTLQRLMSSEAVLYTEMVTTNAIVRNTHDTRRFLGWNYNVEEPVVLQLGGSDPEQMKIASKIASNEGYNQININCGCPSDKVAGAGCFGASLMLKPDLVAQLSLAVGEATGRPATIKCRIGVDDNDSYEQLVNFVRTVHEVGKVSHFIVHARKALLGGKFSPEDNRKIPPLKYDYVYNLIKDFPHLHFSINGGINTMEEIKHHLDKGVAGVMIGRAVINTPYYWRNIDSQLYDKPDAMLPRREIIEKYSTYAQHIENTEGQRARRALIKPVLNLFSGEPNGKLFRRIMDSTVNDLSVPIDQVLRSSMQCLRDSTLDSTESIKGNKNSAETLSTFKSNRQDEDAAIVSNRL
jgi:tRNA-dihydrouridine synthase A